MTNLEAAIAVLERHREARHWADEAVAKDMLSELGLKETVQAKHATAVADEFAAAERDLAEREAVERVAELRAASEAQRHVGRILANPPGGVREAHQERQEPPAHQERHKSPGKPHDA